MRRLTQGPHELPARGRARARAGRGGFTLIELVVSLVAGLIVAIAVMGVSKEATNTFHEEVRVSGAEMGLRIAMERIRLDLQRAAFMSSGNLTGDPLVAQAANFVGAYPNIGNFSGATVPYSFQYLAGISLYPAGASVLSDTGEKGQITAPPNNLAPDSIDIGGNMSSSDEYAAAVVWNPPGGGAGGCSGTAAISLEMTTPAGWRIRNAEALGGNTGAALQALFHPGASPTSEFLIRLTDQSGRYQYLVGCAGAGATTYTVGGNLPVAMVWLSPASTVLSTNATGGLGGVAGFAAGWVTVSPVEIARWDIQTPAQLTAASAAGAAQYLYNQTISGISNDPSDFYLTRSYLDFSTACTNAAKCPVDPLTTEIISEYAVDMKFGFTVDKSPAVPCAVPPCAINAPSYTTNPLVNVAMSQTATTLNTYSNQTGVFVAGVGPQRIRDVQVRLGIRSRFGDRGQSLPLTPSSAIDNTYLYRYLLDATSLPKPAPAAMYARVREATTDVNLPNQARFYW